MGRIIAIVIVVPFLYLGAVLLASEFGGEVVTVETHDAQGRKFLTSVWVVDLYGDVWIRASDPESAWAQRIRRDPSIKLTRDGKTTEARAEIVEDFGARINDGMREKYGLADRLISPIRDEDAAVAIRVVTP